MFVRILELWTVGFFTAKEYRQRGSAFYFLEEPQGDLERVTYLGGHGWLYLYVPFDARDERGSWFRRFVMFTCDRALR